MFLKNLLVTASAAILMFTSACTQSFPVIGQVTDVYVSGDSVSAAYSSNQVVKYWKNGVAVNCSPGTQNNDCYSMAVSGSTVYLSGMLDQPENNLWNAMAWKNGTGVKLSTGNYGSANTVKVSGNDVYYGGNIGNIATYWKNGVQGSVSDGLNYAFVQDMAFSGSDLNLLIQTQTDTTVTAAIWKSGVITNFYANTGQYARDVVMGELAISGSDIYVAATIPSANDIGIAEYFKNGIATRLSDSTKTATAVSMAVAGADIYVAGSTTSQNGITQATYWKNGMPVNLSGGTHAAYATSIFILENDVYVAGYESNGSVNIAKYWKNGVAVILSHGTTSSVATKIIVFQHL